MTVIIAGERSGVGKTTVTLALLAFLSRQGYRVQSFKVGPDYIDPMFHTRVTGIPCRNLDPILTSEAYVRDCYASHCNKGDLSLIEGVMGLFDGVNFPGVPTPLPDYASTAHIARILNLPVILVIDCGKLSTSVAAIVQGYRSLDPNINLIGVILNRVGSDRHLHLLKTALSTIDMPVLGVLRRQELTIPARHLGLIPGGEIPEIEKLFDRLAHLARESFDWPTILPHLRVNNPSGITEHFSPPGKVRIGIAYDRSFNFYYQDNLDILQKLGAELIAWSPLTDERLPENLGGLYIGGGFPEIFAPELSANRPLIEQLRGEIDRGLPVYAECGGLMYLCDNLQDFDGKIWPMAGVIPNTAIMTRQLTLGYRQAHPIRKTELLNPDFSLWGHEFHYSRLKSVSDFPLYRLHSLSNLVQEEGWARARVHASYLHLHFGGAPEVAKKFIDRCVVNSSIDALT